MATPTTTPEPTPKPVKSKSRPPCPGASEGPPGHNKGDASTRPCGDGKSNNPKGGMVVVFPLVLASAAIYRRSRSLRRDRR